MEEYKTATDFYALISVKQPDGTNIVRFLEPKISITEAIEMARENFPGCKIKLFERVFDKKYNLG